MYRTPGRAYSHFRSPDSMKQVIDREAKTMVLSNAQGAFEGSPNSKTIITGVENKAKVIPLENLTIGQIIEVLPFISSQHSRNSKEYKTFETITDYVVKNSNLTEKKNPIIDLGG